MPETKAEAKQRIAKEREAQRQERIAEETARRQAERDAALQQLQADLSVKEGVVKLERRLKLLNDGDRADLIAEFNSLVDEKLGEESVFETPPPVSFLQQQASEFEEELVDPDEPSDSSDDDLGDEELDEEPDEEDDPRQLRQAELEAAHWQDIQDAANKAGITEKPEGGWKETIPDILDYEFPPE
jgi:hypothetical protein